MTMTMMRSLPHLPLLPTPRALRVLLGVGMPKAVIASLSAMTRMQVHRLTSGRSQRPHTLTQDAVSELAYKVLRAKRAGVLDRDMTRIGVDGWKQILDDPALTPLSALTARELLTNQPAEGADHAAA